MNYGIYKGLIHIIVKGDKKEEWIMADNVHAKDTLKKNRENFAVELKMYINERLFSKNLITEDMYWSAKEHLIRQVG